MRRIVFCCVGAMVGHLLGWILDFCWLAVSGNLMMPQDVYEARKTSINSVSWLIIAYCTALGGVLGLFWGPRTP